MTDLERLAALVREMRNAQSRYFEARDVRDLQEAKRLEVLVDRFVASVLDRNLFS